MIEIEVKVNKSGAGCIFEKKVISAISGQAGVAECLDTDFDTVYGTDFFLYGIPCDATLNSQKDHLTMLPDSFLLRKSNCEIKFGIRTGNDAHNFYDPVLVMCFDHKGFFTDNDMDEVAKDLKSNFKAVSDTAVRAYRANAVPG